MKTVHPDRAAWLAARDAGIGASEMAAAMTEHSSGMGLSPHVTRYQLWAEKSGLLEREELTGEQLWWGHELEPLIEKRFRMTEQGQGWRIEDPGEFTIYTSEDHPWLFATPDRLAFREVDGEAQASLLEFKAVSSFADGWDGNEPPTHKRIQCQVQMMCTGLDHGYIAAVCGDGWKLKVWEFGYSQRLAEQIIEQGTAFWALVEEAREILDQRSEGSEHFANGSRLREIERSLGVGAKDKPYIQRLHPGGSGQVVDFDEDLEGSEAIDEFLYADARGKAWSKEAENRKATVQKLAGDADRIDWRGKPAMQRNAKGSWLVKKSAREAVTYTVGEEVEA